MTCYNVQLPSREMLVCGDSRVDEWSIFMDEPWVLRTIVRPGAPYRISYG